jgi:NDP-sugar pyrophosphorylase family protein
MKAMIFAAGLGTRLRPLTIDRPKALVEVNSITMLEIAIRKLKNAGVDQLIINIHHYASLIREFVAKHDNFGIKISFSDETDQLLDTGGGLKKAEWFLTGSEPFFVYNVDILTDLDLLKMIEAHNKSNSLATLAIRERPGNRFFLFDIHYRLYGWKNIETMEEKLAVNTAENLLPFAFSGIHLIDPSIFGLIEETGVFSIIDTYLRLAKNHPITGYLHNDNMWIDLGKPEKVRAGEEAMEKYGIERFL